ESPAPDRSFAVLHGLYWLACNLASSKPVLLVVDDAHWADEPSLRWLAYLATRLEGLSISPSCAETRLTDLRGLAVVEFEQPAKALTTRDWAGTDHRCRGRDECVVQPLVRAFFMIMIDKRAKGGPKVRFAEGHHSLQALGLGRPDKA